MAKYTKSEILRLCMFWFFVSGIVFLVLSSILGIAGVDKGLIACFAVGVVLLAPAVGIWAYIKIRQRNRKITNH